MIMRTELDAAGIRDPQLRSAYQRCRDLNAQYGRTFFLATRLLAPAQRPAVHALYGFARLSDDIMDDVDPMLDATERAARLQRLAAQFFDGGEHTDDPVLSAVIHTARSYAIAPKLFADFLAS